MSLSPSEAVLVITSKLLPLGILSYPLKRHRLLPGSLPCDLSLVPGVVLGPPRWHWLPGSGLHPPHPAWGRSFLSPLAQMDRPW